MRRRTFLGATLAAFAPRPFGQALAASDAADDGGRRELVARPSTEPLVGMPYPPTPVWAFGGGVPGPEIRLRRGESLSLAVVVAPSACTFATTPRSCTPCTCTGTT